MNIKKAKQEIKDTIEAYLLKDSFGEYVIPAVRQRPVLLIGPPGVGKTQIMEQISGECGIGLVAYTITHHTRQSAIGLPFIEKQTFGGKEYTVTEYTMSEIVASVYHKMEETGLSEGILFLDEINCVSETLAPAMLQLLQCKSFGNHKLPQGWIIVAAGNPPEFNKSVREFDVVTLDRIKKIDVEPDFAVWKEYAEKEGVYPAVQTYLNIKPQYLCQIERTVDGKRFATPRGWDDLSDLLKVYEKLGKKADRDVVYQYIQHPAIAKDFANYLELYEKYRREYKVDEILSGTIRESVCRQAAKAPFDEKLSLVGLLLSKLSGCFASCQEKSGDLELMMEKLRRHKEPISALQEISGEYEEKKKEELLTVRQEQRYRRVSALLEGCIQELRESQKTDAEEVWQWLRQWFGKESDDYEAMKEKGGRMLECAFDFMEAAFGTGQEMVIFVTELNSNFYCIAFLEEYDCSRYYEYNKNLLFEDREQDLLKRLEKTEFGV